MTKGTDYKTLMWAYTDERSRRKLKYVKSSRQKPDYNRKLHKPYRCERVMNQLFNLEWQKFHANMNTTGGI